MIYQKWYRNGQTRIALIFFSSVFSHEWTVLFKIEKRFDIKSYITARISVKKHDCLSSKLMLITIICTNLHIQLLKYWISSIDAIKLIEYRGKDVVNWWFVSILLPKILLPIFRFLFWKNNKLIGSFFSIARVNIFWDSLTVTIFIHSLWFRQMRFIQEILQK